MLLLVKFSRLTLGDGRIDLEIPNKLLDELHDLFMWKPLGNSSQAYWNVNFYVFVWLDTDITSGTYLILESILNSTAIRSDKILYSCVFYTAICYLPTSLPHRKCGESLYGFLRFSWLFFFSSLPLFILELLNTYYFF